jgi:hypothetical protein
MALAIKNVTTGYYAGNGTSHSFAHTLSSDAKRKVILFGGVDDGDTITVGPAWDGNAMTRIEAAHLAHASDSGVRGSMWYYDVPDVHASGAFNVTFTTNATQAATYYLWEVSDCAEGLPASAHRGSQTSSSATTSLTLICPANSIILAGIVNSASTPTFDTWNGIAERTENDEASLTTAIGDGSQGAAANVVVSVVASTTSTNKVLVAISLIQFVAPAAGGGALPLVNGGLVG